MIDANQPHQFELKTGTSHCAVCGFGPGAYRHNSFAIPSKTFKIEDGNYYEGDPHFDIFSWSPSPAGTENAPVTQVHLHGVTSLGKFLFRFKSPRSLDSLIDALVKHREDVWGKR